jgi:hypothetical protein
MKRSKRYTELLTKVPEQPVGLSEAVEIRVKAAELLPSAQARVLLVDCLAEIKKPEAQTEPTVF